MIASVSFVSLILVVLNAIYPDWLCAHKQETPMGNEQTRTQPRVFQCETLTSNSFHSLGYARGNESII